MAAPIPLSDAEKDQIRALYKQGKSRNEIGRELSRSGRTISNFCEKEGMVFPSSFHKSTIEANRLSLKERSLQAHERQLKILEYEQQRVLDHYEKGTPWPTKLRAKGGLEYVSKEEAILSEDWRNVATALANSSQTLKHLAPLETPSEVAAKSMADKLSEMFGLPRIEGAADAPRDTPATAPAPE